MSLNDKLAAFFQSHANTWIDGRELATVAGAYAWRSRCADLRKRGMVIENRQRRVLVYSDGLDNRDRYVTVSEYRLLPPAEPSQLSLIQEATV